MQTEHLSEQDIKIEEFLSKFIDEHAQEGFKFRKGQKEAIVSIVQTFFDKSKKHYFLSAPTGSGKSVIAIIVSYILNQFGYTGYILASDLSLQKQYESDFARFGLGWGSVAGLDNYTCSENGDLHRNGNCRMRMESTEKIKCRKCYKECEYFCARNKASNSQTSLLNYSYWLVQDVNAEDSPFKYFQKRDFVICDEAHKLNDIIQNNFSPKINEFTMRNLQMLKDLLGEEVGFISYSSEQIREVVTGLFNETDPEKLFLHCNQFELITEKMLESAAEFKAKVAKSYASTSIPNYLKKYIKTCNWLKEIHDSFENYCLGISDAGIKSMVVCRNEGLKEVVFKSLNERYLMETYFHQRSEFSLLMTATMGSPKTFYKNIKGKEVNGARAFSMPSTFNFDKSPIYVFPGHSMSFAKKEESLPWICGKIKDILEEHSGEKGIIHCGSFAIGQKIKEVVADDKRMYNYESNDKSMTMFQFENSSNGVLVGPSILEGINLENDRSRFQIFAKMPFASLSDEFVSAKLKINPEWYQTDAIIKVLQGVGRSVRNENDWAITYILDSDFIRLWKNNKDQFPKEFNDRLVFMY